MIASAEQYRLQKLRSSIKVGETVYVVPTDSRYFPFTATVISIGKKYIAINGVYKGDSKFTLDTFVNVCSDKCSSKYELHASEEDYNKYKSIALEACNLIARIKTKLSSMPLDTLCAINTIIENNAKNK